MPKAKHPFFDAILAELSTLNNITPRAMFGHQGYAFGTSVFAFLVEDRLVVRSTKYTDSPLPPDLSFFMPEVFKGKKASSGRWIGIHFDDSLSAISRYWHLIEESYKAALQRDSLKSVKKETATLPRRRSVRKI
jgi:hypothetical protein